MSVREPTLGAVRSFTYKEACCSVLGICTRTPWGMMARDSGGETEEE